MRSGLPWTFKVSLSKSTFRQREFKMAAGTRRLVIIGSVPLAPEVVIVATSREKLESTLAELQAELADLGELDATTRQRLLTTLGEIRAALAQPPANKDAPLPAPENAAVSLAERLNDATRGLESTHPELSTTLGGVINALAQMGI
jgi:hypothetical protein